MAGRKTRQITTTMFNVVCFSIFLNSFTAARHLQQPNQPALARDLTWSLWPRDGSPSINAVDPFDHAWIETYTALGDSYSVGLGAGHAISAADGLELNTECSQYSYGYPNILNGDGMIGNNPNRNFQYFGCSGALVTDVTNKQVSKMQTSQLVTLSAGGNDAHLAVILNYCVYQWWVWPQFWACPSEIDSANLTINSADYTSNMQNLLTAIKSKLADSNSRIYWTGYQRFFDDSNNACDGVTWAFSYHSPQQHLTQDLRSRMNSLVDNVNAKIAAVCSSTPQCVFVDSSDGINTLGGHFCEPDVDESYSIVSGGASANREQTWFYEWRTTKDDDTDDDSDISQPQKRDNSSNTSLANTTVPGNVTIDDGVSFEQTIANLIEVGQAMGQLNTTDMGPEFKDPSFGSALPVKYGRVFHLDKFANGVVAIRILNAMDTEQASQMQQPKVTTTFYACQATADPDANTNPDLGA